MSGRPAANTPVADALTVRLLAELRACGVVADPWGSEGQSEALDSLTVLRCVLIVEEVLGRVLDVKELQGADLRSVRALYRLAGVAAGDAKAAWHAAINRAAP
jgi:hypothetical protein